MLSAIEVVDSRIRDWDIGIVETIADDAVGRYVIGGVPRRLDQVDARNTIMTMRDDRGVASEGASVECSGSPVNAVAWLATTLATLGQPLRPGQDQRLPRVPGRGRVHGRQVQQAQTLQLAQSYEQQQGATVMTPVTPFYDTDELIVLKTFADKHHLTTTGQLKGLGPLKQLGPAFQQTYVTVTSLLTTAAMQAMNKAVAVGKQDPASVAHAFLQANHLLSS